MKEDERNHNVDFVKLKDGYVRVNRSNDYMCEILSHNKNRTLWHKLMSLTVCKMFNHLLDDATIAHVGYTNKRGMFLTGLCKLCRSKVMSKERFG